MDSAVASTIATRSHVGQADRFRADLSEEQDENLRLALAEPVRG